MSERQQQIYDYIKIYTTEKRFPPTIREIATAVGLKSSSTVHRHLGEMREKRYIDFVDSAVRTISIVD